MVEKWYLNKMKIEHLNISFAKLLVVLKQKLEIYRYNGGKIIKRL